MVVRYLLGRSNWMADMCVNFTGGWSRTKLGSPFEHTQEKLLPQKLKVRKKWIIVPNRYGNFVQNNRQSGLFVVGLCSAYYFQHFVKKNNKYLNKKKNIKIMLWRKIGACSQCKFWASFSVVKLYGGSLRLNDQERRYKPFYVPLVYS